MRTLCTVLFKEVQEGDRGQIMLKSQVFPLNHLINKWFFIEAGDGLGSLEGRTTSDQAD